jgi:phage virion morphogenesis protein
VIAFGFSLLGGPEVRQSLGRARAAAGDLRPLMDQISAALAEQTEDAFERERDPETGEAWARLAPSTIEQREEQGYWPGLILQRTGDMADSIVADAGADFASLAIDQPYAFWHQVGTERMPARPILGVSDALADQILGLVEDHIAGRLR